MLTVLPLAFSLGLDNARTSVGLGALRPSPARQLRIAGVFGLWDAGAPLAGLLIGGWVGSLLGSWAQELGPLVLAAYGILLMLQAIIGAGWDPLDDRWVLMGLPLALSLDNLVAGVGLGLRGFPPVVVALQFGLVTASMSFVALQLGAAVAHFFPRRSEILAGVVLVTVAAALSMGWW